MTEQQSFHLGKLMSMGLSREEAESLTKETSFEPEESTTLQTLVACREDKEKLAELRRQSAETLRTLQKEKTTPEEWIAMGIFTLLGGIAAGALVRVADNGCSLSHSGSHGHFKFDC